MRRGVVLRSAWRMARAYWFSEEKWSAWLLLSSVIGLNLVLVYVTVQLNLWQGLFFQVIQDYNYDGFIDAVLNYSLLAIVFVVVKGYQIQTRMQLDINWRRWLTDKYLNQWLQKMNYYRLQLLAGNAADNPDQRISEDVDLFVSLTLRLSIDLLNDIVTIFSFILILWNLSGVIYVSLGSLTIPIYGYLVWAALAYAGIGTYWTIRIGRPLVRLDYDRQRFEADFRFSLVRVREHAESIALYNGEVEEKKNCLRHFMNIVNNFTKIIHVRKKLMWLTTSYSRIAVIFAILVASPRYFRGQIHLGQMFQIIDAYEHVQIGFSFVIDSFTRLAQWRAVVNRLNNFLTYMETVQLEATSQKELIYNFKKGDFCVNYINIFRPDGYRLIKSITLQLKPNQRLLVTGPSGCGKSTLLRTFAKLWPFASGHIDVPADRKIMFVPQKTYMPIDQLRKVLLYPGVPWTVSDTDLIAALQACKLPQLTAKLNETQDWGHVLSLGEQQRIAFVRILLSKPDWLFLDEATSALDESTEREIYQLISRLLIRTAIVSVGHRKTLFDYHTSRLDLDGKGDWHLSSI